MQISLSGKVAIVTGAASGIGLATVEQFLQSDISGVVAVDIQPDCPAAFKSHAARVGYVCGDVGLEETAKDFTSTAMERFGRIDVLFNNAGVSVVKPIHLHSNEEWDRVMNTNVKSLFLAAKFVIPIMIKQHSGLILNTGSISGLAGIPGQDAYGASKGALHQITRQMAIEYAAQGIRVNTIAVGTVDTPIVQGSAIQSGDPEGFVQMLKSLHPIGRIASAQEVADFVTFLASDRATFFTGATLSLDGGFTAK